jgi:hypothetical protein
MINAHETLTNKINFVGSINDTSMESQVDADQSSPPDDLAGNTLSCRLVGVV